MIVTPVKTDRIRPKTLSVVEVLDQFLPPLADGSVIAVTSKLVSICEGRLVPFKKAGLQELIEQESDYFLSPDQAKHKLTITKNILIPKAGIDTSDFSQSYILWPENAQATANQIRKYLSDKTGLKDIGVIITDSTTAPLLRGVRGIALAHSGFLATKKSKTEVRANMAAGLAAAAVLVMGEGSEQTPIAIISDLPFIEFVDRDPKIQELNLLNLDLRNDLYGPLLGSVDWQRGKSGQ